MNNGYGSVETNVHEDLNAFDQLPRALRQACRYAVASWSCVHALKELRDLTNMMELPVPVASRLIIDGMAYSEPEDTYRAYGPDHPEADNHGRRLKPAKFATWRRA
ncbi:MAG: hypothetical protein AAF891_00170 [Pseudomonadota bacterium]